MCALNSFIIFFISCFSVEKDHRSYFRPEDVPFGNLLSVGMFFFCTHSIFQGYYNHKTIRHFRSTQKYNRLNNRPINLARSIKFVVSYKLVFGFHEINHIVKDKGFIKRHEHIYEQFWATIARNEFSSKFSKVLYSSLAGFKLNTLYLPTLPSIGVKKLGFFSCCVRIYFPFLVYCDRFRGNASLISSYRI